MEENRGPQLGLTDRERFPTIDDFSLLNQLRQDAYAPTFNFKSGDRLTMEHLQKVRHYEAEILQKNQTFWKAGEQPSWMGSYLKWCHSTVPYFMGKGKELAKYPTISRNELRDIPHLMVSKEADLEDLLVYHTSGSTGPIMDVLFDPVSQASWLPQIISVLDNFGINMEMGKDKVAIAMICAQEKTLTYASLSSYLEGAGILKLNLNPAEWSNPNDAISYLEKYNPQVLTGDPTAFMALHGLQPKIRPKAMISSAMALNKNTQKVLEQYFRCPVIDVYSLTECRNIAYATENGHRAIRPDLYLEIFDPNEDILLPNGERGELTVTGGNNPFLPLVRYRTGDFCGIELKDGIPYLIDLEARQPVVFRTKTGRIINTIDISRALSRYPLVGFKMHQSKNIKIDFKGFSNETIQPDITKVLREILKDEVPLKVEIKKIAVDKNYGKSSYSTDL
ncbi:AMP-binding protein [Maribacter sp. TH_r10]|uniref:AMP-binding protein n=1 Tax=Maribacter sp. TH_r10 TaxID=3082086 RepID=UPI0029541962|nr:AMP-binding protein [Maribacter sp. TH_r10]MDV7137766.1 AMP-binding protein [Maribacter sp. TH_r10]